MAKIVAMLEEAEDSTWTASMIGVHTVLGTGATREAAIDDLREGVNSLQQYLKSKGEELFSPHIEIIQLRSRPNVLQRFTLATQI